MKGYFVPWAGLVVVLLKVLVVMLGSGVGWFRKWCRVRPGEAGEVCY